MPNDDLEIESAAMEAHSLPESMTQMLSQPSALAADLASGDADALTEDDSSFVTNLLGALAAMAVRSKRRQADLAAALIRSGLHASADRITAALRHLEHVGCIEDLVPLYDGGVLMSVTSRGIEHLNIAPRWTMLDNATLRHA